MATETFFSKPALTPERAAFYGRLGERSTAPLWEVLGKLVSPDVLVEANAVLVLRGESASVHARLTPIPG